MLHQGTGGRQQEERQTNRADYKFRDRPCGVCPGLWAPTGTRTNGRGPEIAQNSQQHSGSAQKRTVNDDLPPKRKPRGKPVRVPVRGEKQQLEDKHAHRPNGCRTTKKSKDFLAEQQLNLEEQKRTEEDRRGKRQRSSPATVRSRRGRTGNKTCVILSGHDRSLDGDTHSITSVGELLRTARWHSRVCAQITMHSVIGKLEVLVGPDLPEVVRQTLRESLSPLSVECVTHEAADDWRNQNSTAGLHSKWYNFRVL